MRQLKISNKITQRDSIALDRYLQEIAKVNLLTAEEEVELAQKIKKGDNAALEKLVKSNLRFVVSVAKQYQNQGLALSDLVNEGNLGLIKAAERFDETKGFKFISYAVWWIRQSIMQSLVEHSRIIRLPVNKVGCFNQINKAMADFEQEYQREPTDDELEKLLKMNISEINAIIASANKPMSMDAPLGFEGGGNMYDIINSDELSETEKQIVSESLKKEIKKAMSVLPERDAEILSYYFGLKGEICMTLEEIGNIFGLTRERVRQIKERALRRIRKTSSCSSLKSYLD
ncbi:MAG: RNA polymerase sigma factor RpoD/SigA [Chitinophagales bacterium]